jgi:hypothetical protein
MPTDTKQLTADEVLERIKEINEFSEEHDDEWRNQVARDLNLLLKRERYGSDYVAAVLRIVERIADFDSIKKKGKPSE